jgi:cell shape-determining protein MreD
MIFILALAAFIIAALCKIFGAHGDWIQWLLIVGGILVASGGIAYLRGWRDPLYRPRA